MLTQLPPTLGPHILVDTILIKVECRKPYISIRHSAATGVDCACRKRRRITIKQRHIASPAEHQAPAIEILHAAWTTVPQNPGVALIDGRLLRTPQIHQGNSTFLRSLAA
jgi:hypothetical protein